MPGAIAALRNITNDKLWIIKIPILSIPVFCYFYYPQYINMIFGNEYIYFAILYIFYLGVSSLLIHRNIKNQAHILPSFFSAFAILNRMIGCTIVCSIPSVLLVASFLLIDNFFAGSEFFIIVLLKIIAALIFLPFICVPTVIYSVNGNLFDILKVKSVLSLSGDFMASFIGFMFQCVFLVGLITYFIYAIFVNFFGQNFIGIQILYSIVSVMTFLMFFSWASDQYGQIIPEIPEKKRRDKASRETF